jgi:hypothetical protein
MYRQHVAAQVDAGASCSLADHVHLKLPQSLLRVVAMAGKVLGQTPIVTQSHHQAIYNCCDGIIATQSLIKGCSHFHHLIN